MDATLCLTLAIVFAACVVQGGAGFGSALILSPVLVLLISDHKDITSFLVIMGLLLNAMMLLRVGIRIKVRQVLLMTLASLAGILVGTFTLHAADTFWLKIGVGAITIVTGIFLLCNYTVPIKKPNAAYVGVGFLSGLLNASTGMSGPPVVLFLSNQNLDREKYLSTLALYGLLSNAATIVTFLVTRTLTAAAFQLTLYHLPAIVLGALVGMKLSSKLKGPTFRKAIIVLIIAIGAYLIVRTVWGR